MPQRGRLRPEFPAPRAIVAVGDFALTRSAANALLRAAFVARSSIKKHGQEEERRKQERCAWLADVRVRDAVMAGEGQTIAKRKTLIVVGVSPGNELIRGLSRDNSN